MSDAFVGLLLIIRKCVVQSAKKNNALSSCVVYGKCDKCGSMLLNNKTDYTNRKINYIGVHNVKYYRCTSIKCIA
jgi:hypothetical protein